MKILQIILSAILILRIGGILKAFQKNNYNPNGLTDLLLFPSLLLSGYMMKMTGSFISLFLIIICLIYTETDLLANKKIKCFHKVLFSILNVLGIIVSVMLFLNYEQ